MVDLMDSIVLLFHNLMTRLSTDGKRAPPTAISLQVAGSPKYGKEVLPTYIRNKC